MILYALTMHDDRNIDQSLLKKKDFPTYLPYFWGHVTGNTHTFLFGLIDSKESMF